MLVGTLALCDLLDKNVHHVVPLYQRPYVWGREQQWEPLWADLRRLAEHRLADQPVRAHFLGATVHEKAAVPPGQIETRLVIDGQQRLTTLQLLLQAFQDAAAARGLDTYRLAIGNLTRNNHPLITKAEERFKVWPTNADQGEFRKVMKAGSPAAVREACGVGPTAAKVGRSIPDAYLFFAAVIGEWLDAGPGAAARRVAALYSALYKEMRLVVIDLDEKDDAQLIFETLNARGTPLLAADLVKNALRQEIRAKGGPVDDLYEQHWQPFDTDAGYWRKQIGRGHAQRPRVDVFLQHLLTLRTKEEVPAAHLYAAYRDHVQKQPGVAADRLADFARYARIYRLFGGQNEHPQVKLFFERLGVMELGTAYPFLLELLNRLGHDEDRIVAVLEDVESLLVRRMVCRLSTRGYNRLFLDLVGALDGDPTGIEARVRAKLLAGTAEYDRWPDDTELEAGWTGNPLYENLTRPRLRLLLEALEARLRGPLAETQNVPRWLTVEHVLPQSWTPHWPLPDGIAPEVAHMERRRVLHMIGNLTLLNDKLNPALSNGPWAEKRAAMQKHTVLHLNHALCASEIWDEATIRDRSRALFEHARAIWPRPALAGASA